MQLAHGKDVEARRADERLRAWLSVSAGGRTQSQFLRLWPAHGWEVEDDLLQTVAARYFGVGVPACAPLAELGRIVTGTDEGADPEDRVVDRAGALLLAMRHGGDHTTAHDGTAEALCRALEWAGAEVTREPVNVFAGAVAEARRAAGLPPDAGEGEQWRRPDFAVRFPGGSGEAGRLRYYEWKLRTLCASGYPRTRDSGAGRRWGAQGRADEVL